MKKLIIANWKANPESAVKATVLAEKIESATSIYKNADIVIAPPFPFLPLVGDMLSRARLGSQDVWNTEGPYTGMVSPRQLKSLGVAYVIIGHSERRIHAGETDDMIQKKLAGALASGLQAVLCVGETERQGSELSAMVGEQVRTALKSIKKEWLRRLTVVYEPVWAISTMADTAGAATPDTAFRARMYIEKILTSLFGGRASRDVRIIYGGSVTPANITSFLTEGAMDGVLVGKASLDPKKIGEIVRLAASL
ncbi:MAG: triose-phosphate isomerase [Patescibacteria group bacterium]|mgnify:FL=1